MPLTIFVPVKTFDGILETTIAARASINRSDAVRELLTIIAADLTDHVCADYAFTDAQRSLTAADTWQYEGSEYAIVTSTIVLDATAETQHQPVA